MAVSLADVVGRFQADVGRVLAADALDQTCRDLQHEFRCRCLDPVTSLHTFPTQILHGNTACTALPHLTGKDFSTAAYVHARSRPPLTLREGLLTAQGLAATPATTDYWQGLRVCLVDSSRFSMLDRPTRPAKMTGDVAPLLTLPAHKTLMTREFTACESLRFEECCTRYPGRNPLLPETSFSRP